MRLKACLFVIAGILMLTMKHSISAGADPAVLAWPAGLPVYDHVVIVVEENKNYDQIIGNAKAPHINQVLKAEGASFTKMFGEEHNSQGDYYWMFSGSNQNVGFVDTVPNATNNPNYPFTASNLGQQLIAKSHSFKGYSESLPSIGFMGNTSPDSLYARKHVPWTSFKNVPNGTTVDTSCNLRFADFPTDFTKLPTVSFVIPNLINDMHNGDPKNSIPAGDAWLKGHIDTYYQWAKTHNSLLIVTFDENDDKEHIKGLTDPFVQVISGDERSLDMQNRVATIFAGAHIKPGEYPEGKGMTHVNILRTLEAMYRLPKSGAQQPKAAAGGISDSFIITDVFN